MLVYIRSEHFTSGLDIMSEMFILSVAYLQNWIKKVKQRPDQGQIQFNPNTNKTKKEAHTQIDIHVHNTFMRNTTFSIMNSSVPNRWSFKYPILKTEVIPYFTFSILKYKTN